MTYSSDNVLFFLGKNSVSQREIQRCFNLIEFFTTGRYGDEARHDQNYFNLDPKCSIALSIALIYYFRLPTKEDNVHQSDTETPTREQLAQALSRTILDFEELINDELLRFVNEENFVIPQGVAINQAVSEIFESMIIIDLFFFSRFVNISSPLWSVLSLEHLCVLLVHLVNRKHFPFKLSYKIFKDLKYLPNHSVDVYLLSNHFYVSDRNIHVQKILTTRSNERSNENNSTEKSVAMLDAYVSSIIDPLFIILFDLGRVFR